MANQGGLTDSLVSIPINDETCRMKDFRLLIEYKEDNFMTRRTIHYQQVRSLMEQCGNPYGYSRSDCMTYIFGRYTNEQLRKCEKMDSIAGSCVGIGGVPPELCPEDQEGDLLVRDFLNLRSNDVTADMIVIPREDTIIDIDIDL